MIKNNNTTSILMHGILTVSFILLGSMIRFMIEESNKGIIQIQEEIPLAYEDSLRLKVLSKGDTDSYLNLRDYFYDTKYPNELLFYSLVMAKQYNYRPAYDDFCKNLKAFYDNHPKLLPMDSYTDSIYKLFKDMNNH